MITTITAYWNRPEMLRRWLKALKTATADPKIGSQVESIVFFAGDRIPEGLHQDGVRFIRCEVPKLGDRLSIGYFHNMGAKMASHEWIMKLDVDAMPNIRYFEKLIPLLRKAKPRQWFNGGMFYINKTYSERCLDIDCDLLGEKNYKDLVHRIMVTSGQVYRLPAATNFICRAEDYLKLGGCDQRFRGYGWEDYQQIYMLERYQQGKDPLPGVIALNNVSERCRNEISRPKARELYMESEFLALLHHWHPGSNDASYKTRLILDENRTILLDYITQARITSNCVLV